MNDGNDNGLLIVGEELCQRLVGRDDAFDAAEAVFGAIACDQAYDFPIIREAHHAIASGATLEAQMSPIGQVINRINPGRASEDEITLFDGSGVELQDLAVESFVARPVANASVAARVAL